MYVYTCISFLLLKKWISNITHEVNKKYPGSVRREQRGDADGSDMSDIEEYDYATSQPIDVSFIDPEIDDRAKTPCSACDPVPNGFEGPKIGSLSFKEGGGWWPDCEAPFTPTPPPRPPLTASKGKNTIQRSAQKYEVTGISIPPKTKTTTATRTFNCEWRSFFLFSSFLPHCPLVGACYLPVCIVYGGE